MRTKYCKLCSSQFRQSSIEIEDIKLHFFLNLVLAMVNSYNENTRLQALYQSSSYKAHHTMGTQDKTRQA